MTTTSIQYTQTRGGWNFYILFAVFGILIGLALLASHHMESHGHYVTGMTNQVVWGMPHIFALFLIVAASGALNMASVGSVFSVSDYKPLGRLSGILAVALLIGGLAVLVLDLGRPDRLIVAMTSYNFKSIFAWNIFLYTGFMVIVAVYLWMMFERRMNQYASSAGKFAFVWRIILTTGTGSIFGFIVARQAYDAAIMGPMFVVMSLSFGTSVFLLVLLASFGRDRNVSDKLINRYKRLNAVLVAAVLHMVLAYHLTNLYATEHHGYDRFILLDGGIYTFLFWVVQIGLGSILPMALFFFSRFKAKIWTVIAALLVIIGGFAQLYVIVIGGQAYPLVLFPGYEVSSQFFDGVFNHYVPSLPEMALGIGGIALALLITMIALRVLPFLPVKMIAHGES